MAPETVTCPTCGQMAPATARFCPNCGRSLVMAFASQGSGRGGDAPTESSYDVTPTTAPMPETTPERPSLEQEAERAGVTGTGGGIPPVEIPATDVPAGGGTDELPADLREDLNAPASYTPPPAYTTTPAYTTPEYSAPETPRYASTPVGQYVPYAQYATPPEQGQYPQYGAPAETRDISRVEVPQTQPTAYGQPYQQPAYPQYGYTRPKDPTIGLLLELIGLFGVLGIGHIYAGKVTRGVILMASFFMYFIVFACLSVVLIGIPFLVLYWVVPIISALYLRNEMERELRQGYQNRY